MIKFIHTPTTYSAIDPFIGAGPFPKHKLWLKNEFSDEDEFCPVECLGNKGSVFYPENAKYKLDAGDILIGEYWNDGNCWGFSLFPNWEHLSV